MALGKKDKNLTDTNPVQLSVLQYILRQANHTIDNISAGTWRNDNIIITSKRRSDVVLTKWWRYYCVACPLWEASSLAEQPTGIPTVTRLRPCNILSQHGSRDVYDVSIHTWAPSSTSQIRLQPPALFTYHRNHSNDTSPASMVTLIVTKAFPNSLAYLDTTRVHFHQSQVTWKWWKPVREDVTYIRSSLIGWDGSRMNWGNRYALGPVH